MSELPAKSLRRPTRPWAEMDEREIMVFLNAMYGAWDAAGVDVGEWFVVARDQDDE